MVLDLSRPHDPDYGYLNGLAHNRTVTWVRAPALVCHVGFWYPGIHHDPKEPFATSVEKSGQHFRDEWKTRIDTAIAETLAAFHDAKIETRNDCEIDGCLVFFNNVSRIGGAPKFIAKTSLSAEVESMLKDDRRTINFYCDADSIKFSLKFQIHSEYFAVTYFVDIDPEFFDGRGEKNSNVRDNFLNDSKFLDKVNLFGSKMREKCNCHRDDESQPLVEPISGYFFMDAWEYIFEHVPPEIRGNARDSQIGKRFADFRGVILSDETVRLPVEPVDGPRPPNWGQRATEIFAPFVSQVDRWSKFNPDRHETTASYMLDGRAFYITSLGYNRSQVSSNSDIPLKYLMYVHQTYPGDKSRAVVNKWQLGRLIDRLFDLGTCRLAALVDLKELRQAGEQLAELEPLTQSARDALNEGRQFATKERILQVHKKINELNIRNGIQYRTERSRYYVERFKAGLPGIRLHRIEGFQPYDRFVEQRLGASFDFVDRLGRRYDRAATAVARLAQDGVLLQLNEIQRLGERFILLFLLPYYSGSLIQHMFCSADWRWFAVVWSFWITVAIFRSQISEIVESKISLFSDKIDNKFARYFVRKSIEILCISLISPICFGIILASLLFFHSLFYNDIRAGDNILQTIVTQSREITRDRACKPEAGEHHEPPTSAPSYSPPPR